MYKVLLAGGIASGKSTVAATLAGLGAEVHDLDQVSREVTRPGSPVLDELARAFGRDILDSSTGELDRGLLARRAFASEGGTRTLEGIELPAIRRAAHDILAREGAGAPACVIEVPLLDRAEELIGEVDEVVCVVCPMDARRSRAVSRGMDPQDFERRVRRQPSEGYLRAHADTVLDNAGTPAELQGQVRRWWAERAAGGWGRIDAR